MLTMKRSRIALAVAIATLGLTACGGGSSSSPAPAPTPSKSAPTDISLSSISITENVKGGVVGELTVTDSDSGDRHMFTTSDERFVIDGTTLKLADNTAFNFENTQTVDVDITVFDGTFTFNKTLSLTIEDTLDFYEFESKINPGASSVSYSGQTARHLLINDLNALIGAQLGDSSTFDSNGTFTSKQDVLDALNSYFDVTDYEALSERALLTTTTPAADQTTLSAVSSSSKNLVGKIAGNDATGQHKDWNNGDFMGWGATGSTTPEKLVREYFDMLATNAETQLAGTTRQDPFGNDITTLYLTDDGRDLKQLIQKFLLMSVAFSQGADDYLDDDTAGKGLLSDHEDTTTGKAYTALEHQFDEGFGYFGAARNYLDYSDEELAQKGGRDNWQGYYDTNGDGKIDFTSEYNFGQSINAAKRDLGATVATDYTAEAMNAFLQGRKLLNDTAGTALTVAQLTELQDYRDTALLAWEKSIAATVVHYINDSIADLNAIGTDEFSYSNLAKHWSEMKGFALGFQFNRRSPMMKVDGDFEKLHTFMKDAPVLTGDAEVTAYIKDLQDARALIQAAYGFNEENVANW
ncbi:DUF4856 domain-containing protein [Aestuariibacter sp. AA17]|uniref:DUF4856 domain-containing protein n=1 Tax=Fluctibacter corallii TaxID=2984329 RepID=A0ABT3AA58_9ALTE|nr:DUF4856 domain-containing protein [Aestuariibacter sp. AA17]MCV2885561.1 DUF4856 domain-containing protein [Aestuariibacter sp. AA17]